MSWSSRRASVIVAVIILLGTFTSLNVAAQKARLGVRKQPLPPGGRPTPPPPKSASGDPTDLGGVTVTADESEQAQLAGRIKAAQDNIDVGDWKKAIEILQNLLEREEDAFVPVTRTIEGRTVKIITSIRAEANRLVGNLPAKAMEVYKLTYGSRADELLKLAKEGDDVRLLAEIMSRYLYTEAGGEATDLLATRLLDRGQYATAALCFEKLIQRQGPDKLSVNTLFRATLAFQQSKDKANLAKAWKFIEGKTDTIKLGNGKKLEVGKMKTWVASRSTGGSGSTRFDWQMVGGNPSRSAQGFGGTAFLEPRWKFNTWRKDTLDTKSHLDKAVEGLAFRKAPLVHGFGPLAVTVNREDGKAPLMVRCATSATPNRKNSARLATSTGSRPQSGAWTRCSANRSSLAPLKAGFRPT
jgi:hypothetical protein